MVDNDDICVYSNSAGGSYKVTATGDGANGFEVANSSGELMAYRVRWNDIAGNSGSVRLQSGQTLSNQTNANTESHDCDGQENARIRVIFRQQELAAASGGFYAGVLNIKIDPE